MRLALLVKGLEDGERFKEKLELCRIDLVRYGQSLSENIKFLKKRGVVSLMEEFAKAKRVLAQVNKQIEDLNIQIRDLNLSLTKQQTYVSQQQKVLNKMIQDSECVVLEFKRKRE